MRFDKCVWIAGAAVWIPPGRDTAAAAVARGRIDAETAAAKAADTIAVAADVSAPEMAVRAANLAVDIAGRETAEIDLLIHSWIYYQGHDLWSPAHYIANEIGAVNCLPMTIHQGCDGGVLAVQDAAMRLSSDPGVHVALVTAADRFVMPGVDRWNNQPAYVLGDGGSAIVLSEEHPGGYGLRIASVCTRTHSNFDALCRGGREFATVPMEHGIPTQLSEAEWTAAFDAVGGRRVMNKISREMVYEVLHEAMVEANVDDDDLRLIVLPRSSERANEKMYRPVLEAFRNVDTRSFYRDTGHLGPADCGADIARIADDRLLEPGRFAALLCVGGGFTWTCVIVQAVAESGDRRA
ncbi:ketoacyl-ACP synthase III family protein [Nocardia sp. NPDC050406]|uniref:ketoacyl-ACP synthase III family protein n=1 Tax=Nocardia sp. NPDC050406 TaxID=3364318 RepID=UPI00378B1232